MEQYVINGHEVEYDTFDLANMELYDSEVRRIDGSVRSLNPQSIGDRYLAVLREQAESLLDFFDTVLGEGQARAIFGDRMNVRDIFTAYRKFTEDVAKEMGKGLAVAAPVPAAPQNREQRRAEERAKRRAEAQAKAAKKAGAHASEPV